ncbi:MAG TPA: hypothetical protein VL981_11420 [Candidatus Methylacidiphilales bacterium]|nr:hypothetical protein [Candidatus Methylacidiphilales bacterium]
MPKTITKTNTSQIIAGVFSKPENASRAVEQFNKKGIPDTDIQVVFELDGKDAEEAFRASLIGRGFAESQALFYDRAVRSGKVLVAVYDVTDPAEVIEIFDRFGAEANPDGSRNVRQDVFGMTAGAVSGAALGGATGAALGGPIGATAGIAAGVVIGAGAGAAAGKAVEHKK